MRFRLFWKIFTILGLLLLLVIPLLMIQGKISDRNHEAWRVERQISQQVSGQQVVGTPLIVLPGVKTERVEKTRCDEQKPCYTVHEQASHMTRIADHAAVTSTVKSEMRYRGIYGVPVYRGLLSFSAEFAPQWRKLRKGNWRQRGKPLLVMQVQDLRGLVERPVVEVNGRQLPVMDTSDVPRWLEGSVIAVALPDDINGALKVSVQLNINGTQSLGLLPLAKDTAWQMQSDWPHPSFQGLVLPVERDVQEGGFHARWHTNNLAAASAIRCVQGSGICQDNSQALSVDFSQPVTGLLSSERALKYSFLIVGLTFAAFFLFEVVKRQPLHAMQYLLVGLAQAVFYLLLVALSEHMVFTVAYSVAALACCALIGVYLVAVLRSKLAGWGFAGSLLLVQAMLFAILMAEDFALLMGASLLFVALAAIMLVTRRLDWYGYAALQAKVPASQEAEPS